MSQLDNGERVGRPAVGTPRLEIRLLGPLEVLVDGGPVQIGSPKQRAILSLLALHAGRVVTAEALHELIWGEDQPASAPATLQSLVSRLRSTLDAADVLRTRGSGWQLDIERGSVDALRFEDLAARARRCRERDQPEDAASSLTTAVGLWRGPALNDVVAAGYLAPHAVRLDEARLDVIEDLADAELAIGRPAEALARLESHVDASPLRERGWGLLMTALYQRGQQAAALRAFQQVRAILADELGLEPSPELRAIEQRILRQDASLGARTVAAKAPVGEFADYSVVVVEDHDFQRRTTVQLLRGLGVGTITEAANGADALGLLAAGAVPDIIVCDIEMPGMDGVEFVSRAAESNLTCGLVIASGLEANVLQAVEAISESSGLRVLAALEKPLTARRLGDVLRRYTRVSRNGVADLVDGGVTGDELRGALASHEAVVRFRPRIDLATGAYSSAEIGTRWPGVASSPLRAPLAVATAEGHDFLRAFLDRLLHESAEVMNRLEPMAPLRFALNVSWLGLEESWLVGGLTEMVTSREQPPRLLVWELDDVVLARASATALQALTRLRVKGFGLSMRYGGAGPSWNHQLQRVPLTEITLDRRLVSGAADDEKRLEVLEAEVASAREHGLAMVADGCDSESDLDMLISLGCSEAEGTFIGEPITADELVERAGAAR